jgi:hypothetical protein
MLMQMGNVGQENLSAACRHGSSNLLGIVTSGAKNETRSGVKACPNRKEKIRWVVGAYGDNIAIATPALFPDKIRERPEYVVGPAIAYRSSVAIEIRSLGLRFGPMEEGLK